MNCDGSGLTYSHPPPTTYHLPPTTYHLPPTTYHLPPTTYHLPPTTYHLPPTTYQLPPTNYQLPPTNYQLPTTNYELRATSYELRVTSYELRATSYELRVTSYELRATSYELRVTSYELRATSYYPPLTGGMQATSLPSVSGESSPAYFASTAKSRWRWWAASGGHVAASAAQRGDAGRFGHLDVERFGTAELSRGGEQANADFHVITRSCARVESSLANSGLRP